MPTAPDHLREEWGGPSDEHALEHLRDRGYKLRQDGSFDWEKPVGLEVSEKDLSAMRFMALEWDYGWLADD